MRGPRQLYVSLYAAFLAMVLMAAAASFGVIFATAPQRPLTSNWGRRVLFHLTRTLSGITDDAALHDALAGAHGDLDVDIQVLNPNLQLRAAAGREFPLPPPALLEQARRGPAWLPAPAGIGAAAMEDKSMLVVRLPGPAAQRRRSRWGLMILAGMACAALLLYPLSRSITRPLEKLSQTAEKFGKGELTARSGIERDDEVGRLARTFDEMAARIQAARKAERELLANVSHELRTPLARLQLTLELLDAKDEGSQRRVAQIREEVEELDRLIGDVLTASRLELAALPLQRRELHVRELAEKARDRLRMLDPERRIDVDVPDELAAPADEALLGRVLDNLVDNARKYDPSGKPIRIEGRRENGDVLLAVQDQGPGIPASDLEAVFEPFFRGQAARSQTSGFGLGLALARRVAEAHGGSIRASNVAGGGARLELRLPGAA